MPPSQALNLNRPQHEHQQQQPNRQESSKKKKYTTKKFTIAGDNELSIDGAGDGGDTVAAVELKLCISEKKPLHTSMEQLKVGNVSGGGGGSVVSGLEQNVQMPQKQTDNTQLQHNTISVLETENKVPNTPDAPSFEKPLSKSARMRQRRKAAQRNKYVAMDCEMVGVGCNGQGDMLARVSIVNKTGDVLLDKFVKPREIVTDYRTSISGIRPRDIEHAEEFNAVQDEVVELLQGKILVGHAIRNDLAVLHIKHPFVNIRDTSRYKPLCRLVSNGRTPSLKRLTQAILGLEIQTGEHNSVEDARAAMNIYNRLSIDWEQYIVKKQQRNNQHQHHNHYHHQHHHKHEESK